MLTNPNFEIAETFASAALGILAEAERPHLSVDARNVLITCLSYGPGTELTARGVQRKCNFPSEAFVDKQLTELHEKGYLRAETGKGWLQLYATPLAPVTAPVTARSAAPKRAKGKALQTPQS